MEKLLDRIGLFLLVIFGLTYLSAKIHFFTRYGALTAGEYVEGHWLFWAAMATIGGLIACLGWIKKSRD